MNAMLWDILVTLGSLALGLYFIVIEPLVRRRRASRPRPSLPQPRYAPPATQKNERDPFNLLLQEFAKMGNEPDTTGTGNEPVPGSSTDTNAQNAEDDSLYTQVVDLVQQGFSANQIAKILGGKRKDRLALVRQVRADLGIE